MTAVYLLLSMIFFSSANEATDSPTDRPYEFSQVSAEGGPLQWENIASAGQCLEPIIGKYPPPPEFTKDDPKALLMFLAPLAVDIQTRTGMPASIILAKAVVESTNGTSYNARQRNNFAGMSCFKKNSTWQTEKFDLPSWGGSLVAVNNACDTSKKRGKGGAEGGHYLKYKHPYDSILHSIHRVMEKKPYNNVSRLKKKWDIDKGMKETLVALRESQAFNQNLLFKSSLTKAPAPAPSPLRGEKQYQTLYNNILKIYDKVYAPDTADCKKCPKGNNDYDKSLLKQIEKYDLHKLDAVRSCYQPPKTIDI